MFVHEFTGFIYIAYTYFSGHRKLLQAMLIKIAVPYKTKSNTLAASVTTALFLSHIAARIVQKIYKNHVKNTAGVP